MPDEHELYELLRRIRYDTTAIQAKLTDAFAMLDALKLPKPSTLKCPTCSIPAKGPRTLAEHIHVSHNGPLPDHWAEADQRINTQPDQHDPPAAVVSDTATCAQPGPCASERAA